MTIFHPVHPISMGSSDKLEKRKVTVDPQTKPTDMGREFAGRLLSFTPATAISPFLNCPIGSLVAEVRAEDCSVIVILVLLRESFCRRVVIGF